MAYYNNSNPLLDSGKIFGYFIWHATMGNADSTEAEDKRVYLGWVHPKKIKKQWYSLLFLKFDYFQEIDEFGKYFVGIQVDKLGHKRYRIFKTRISNLIKNENEDVITYPAISSESYSDLQWMPEERVFKVFNLSGECSILIPPKWEQCNNIPFYDCMYDPYSQFKYWPNTDFGHFKDFNFRNKVLFGENYDGTLAIISSKGEIMSYAWSEIQITDSGITFRDKDKIFQKITFDQIEDYYQKELSKMEKQLKVALQATHEKSLENLQDKKVLDTNNSDDDNSTTDKTFENICWLYKSFEKQYDNKTIKINNPDRKIVTGELILCLYEKSYLKTAYIVRYSGRNKKYHSIERRFELTDETTVLRKELKSGRLPNAMQYSSQMTNDELVASFMAISPSICAAQPASEIQDNDSNNIQTKAISMENILYNKPVSELIGNDFAGKIRQVSDFLSISFPSDKVFECLTLLFGENIKNIKDYSPETDALLESAELDTVGEIERKVNANKVRFLTSEQLQNFNLSINYHMTLKKMSYMQSLENALADTAGSEELGNYIEGLKAHLKQTQAEREKELASKILKLILEIGKESSDATEQIETKSVKEIYINNRKYKIGDIFNEKELWGDRAPRKFLKKGDFLLIFLSDAECTNKGIYEIKGEGESGNQIIGQNANGDIVNISKRKIIITKNPANGTCKIFDEVVYVDKYEKHECTNNQDRTVFYFKLRSTTKC